MKNLSQYITLLFGVLLLASGCAKAPVVLEFDDSYTPAQPKKGERDTPPPVDLLTVYSYFKTAKEEISVTRSFSSEGVVEEVSSLDDRVLIFRTSVAVEQAMNFKIEKMTAENAPEDFPKVIKGSFVELPAAAFTVEHADIALQQGEKSAEVRIRFHVEAFKTLDKSKNYVLPLVIIPPKESGVKVLGYYTLTITLTDVQALPSGENVSVVKELSGERISGSALTVNTDYAENHVYKVNDGESAQWSGNWWVPSHSQHWLTLHFETTKVKGIVIATKYPKYITSLRVSVSQDGGVTMVEQGTVTTEENYFELKIAFDKPVEINAVKLDQFVGAKDYVDVLEVEMVKE